MTKLDNIADAIYNHGGELYYVGGYVRNAALGLDTNDIDIECFGIPQATFENILQQFGHLEILGKEFGIYKLLSLPDIDFALPRQEKKRGEKHTDFQVEINPFISLKTAARRRDFTCNAMYQNVRTGEIIDPFNGQKDLKKGVLKHIDDTTFIEDNLRGLRACQFAARLNLTIHPQTQTIIKMMQYNHLSKERIFVEIQKGIESQHPDIFMHWMFQLNIIKKIAPALANTSKEQQQIITSILQQLDKSFSMSDILGIIAFFTKNEPEFLHSFTNSKQTIREAKKTTQFLKQLQTVDNSKSLRLLKQVHPGKTKANKIIISFEQAGKPILPNRFDSLEQFNEQFKQANSNNPQKEKLILGRDLIKLGYQPGPTFSKLLNIAYQFELDGYSKKEILKKIERI